jgi:hypothetical protein
VLACESAVSQANPQGKTVETALSIIREGGSQAAIRIEIEALISRFDAEYLRLQEQMILLKSRRHCFSFGRRGRLPRWAFALSAEPDQLHEALYEAAFATEDPAGVIRSVQSALV